MQHLQPNQGRARHRALRDARARRTYTPHAPITQQRYHYRSYLQIAALDLLTNTTKHTILWDPTQPTATRPLSIQQAGTWYTYKTPGGCKGGWTCAQHAPRRGEDSMGRVRINYRYYNPVDGRWTRRDPLPQQGSSLHDYILNNPINTSDYLGLQLVMPYHAAKGVPGLTNSVNINQANQAWKFMRAFLCAFRAPTIDKPSPTFLEDQYNPNDEGDITRDYKAWLCSRLLYCI